MNGSEIELRRGKGVKNGHNGNEEIIERKDNEAK